MARWRKPEPLRLKGWSMYGTIGMLANFSNLRANDLCFNTLTKREKRRCKPSRNFLESVLFTQLRSEAISFKLSWSNEDKFPFLILFEPMISHWRIMRLRSYFSRNNWSMGQITWCNFQSYPIVASNGKSFNASGYRVENSVWEMRYNFLVRSALEVNPRNGSMTSGFPFKSNALKQCSCKISFDGIVESSRRMISTCSRPSVRPSVQYCL